MSLITPGAREVRRRVFTVRKKTTTREALRFAVAQRQDENGALLLCTLTVQGNIINYIESPRYVRDVALKLIAAYEQMEDWNHATR